MSSEEEILTRQEQLSAAWTEGASAPVDSYGRATVECYYPHDPELAAAWHKGVSETRDTHGEADLFNDPYDI